MDLVIKLLTEFRDEMNGRFERMEQRMDKRFEEMDRRFQDVNRRMTDMRVEIKGDIAKVHVELTRDIGGVNGRFDDVLLDRREMRTRLERCERDIDELKRR